MQRRPLPNRRPSWRQHANVGGQSIYLTCGEHEEDGTLGEIFLDASRAGTFVRGVLEALARVSSKALEHGLPVEQLVKALRGLNFPPNGPVTGTQTVQEVDSVADWVACELEAAYLRPRQHAEKVAGHVAEECRTGA